VALDDSRDTRIISQVLPGIYLEWQEDGKEKVVGSVVMFKKCSSALWVAAVYQ
jgi:hypothetical protein